MTGLYITLKIASSLDGRIALSNGASQWITSSDARARGHQMRAAHDAILVGIGTALADDPILTARTVPAPARQPKRIIMDSAARLPINARLLQTLGTAPLIIACTDNADADSLAKAGADIWRCGRAPRVSPAALVQHAIDTKITSILIEGGGSVAAGFLSENLIDEIAWFRAPILIGGDGRAAIGDLGLETLSGASRWRPVATERIGDDVLDTYVRV